MKAKKILLPLAILLVGIVVLMTLVKTKPKPEKTAAGTRAVVVETVAVKRVSSRVTVRARGTVIPSQQVALGPEVSGKVRAVAQSLVPGGRFEAGAFLVRLDPSEYQLAVKQQFAAVDSAQTQLSLEKGRKRIAEREWELFKAEQKGAGSPLALREPQLKTAQVQFQAAQSGLKRARLNVSRTILRAPFNGVVQERTAELGQMVAAGTPLLNFVGTDAFWVQISIPVERLKWISVPGVTGKTEGSEATIVHNFGEQQVARTGRVIRLLPDVDPVGRMARVLVEIDNPLGVSAPKKTLPNGTNKPKSAAANKSEKDTKGGVVASAAAVKPSLPLLLGAYVDVTLEGEPVEGVVELPRTALREGDLLYLMAEDSTLRTRSVAVLWRREDTVLIKSGVAPGDRVIVSPLSSAVEGMKVRLSTSESNRETADRGVATTPGAAGVSSAGAKPTDRVGAKPAQKSKP